MVHSIDRAPVDANAAPHHAAAAVTGLTSNIVTPVPHGVIAPSAAWAQAATAVPSPPPAKAPVGSWGDVSRTLLAGGIAGCVAKTAVAPLDRVKILFQGSNPTVRHFAGTALGGFRAIWWSIHKTQMR